MMRSHKYNARKTEYNGVLYDSKGEANLARELDLRERCKEIRFVKRQVTVELVGKNLSIICKHVVDFWCIMPDGTEEVHEFKGVKTRDWSLKHKLFCDNYPHIKYILHSKNQ